MTKHLPVCKKVFVVKLFADLVRKDVI